MKHLFKSSIIAIITISILFGNAVFVTPARASALTVTKTADTNDGTCNGDCSLREAIAAAGPTDTITFHSSLSGGTIYLSSTLMLSQNITIDGSALASKITISGDSDMDTDGDVRVFYVNSGVTATLNSLIVTKGLASGGSPAGDGGGLYNNGTLTITNSIFTSNTATAGGAITSNNTLTITNSTFSNNSATDAGAIMSAAATLTISGSTFSGNTANPSTGSGGALYNFATATISNSTFSGNSAGIGGAIITNEALTIKNSTISGNSALLAGGGGLDIENQTTNLSNTIIANSTGSDCYQDPVFANIGTNTNNLIEDGSCPSTMTGDPGLGALASNGGPTQTLALLAYSVAIDAGNNATCTTSPISNLDQRGVTRPNGTVCDMGAYEYEDTTSPSVTGFTVNSLTSNLNIPISSLTASDDATVAAYLITETATPPAPNDSGWTGSAPTAYTVGGEGTYSLYPWAKDAAGNVSAVYGSPASVTVDTTAPCLCSNTRANPSPTNKASVGFTLTFSEAVTGVGVADFTLTTTGITGASVSGVSGTGATRTVTVNTGSGNGTIRLDLPVTATITDIAGNAFTNLPYTSGDSYTVNKTLTFISTSTQDGWVLETTETSEVGGTLDSTASTFRLGDSATKQQYRGILSFTTSSIPDTAVITGVSLKVKKQGAVGGGDPVSIFQGFFAEIKTGIFGTGATLQAADFQAASSKTVGPTSPVLQSGWYTLNLVNSKTFINKLTTSGGLTQIRLRFKLDDNNNTTANYLSLYSGNAGAAPDRPQLVITYYIP